MKVIIECPYCKTSMLVEEEDAAGRGSAALKCQSCSSLFSLTRPKSTTGANFRPPAETATVVSADKSLPEGKSVALVAMSGPVKGEVFYVTKPVVEIGRSGADIIIKDPEVSNRHCQLEMRGEVGHLTDMGSTNGIVVEGNPVKSCQVYHLTEFRIGKTTLMLTITSEESQ